MSKKEDQYIITKEQINKGIRHRQEQERQQRQQDKDNKRK